jgi:hypothetical protein
MGEDGTWRRVADAVETTALLAQSAAFNQRIGRLCEAYVAEIQDTLKPDDMPILIVPVQLKRDGKKPPCIALFLQDRALLFWSTGFVRMQSHLEEIPYHTVRGVEADGRDELHIDAGEQWSLGGFKDPAPIMRDLLAAVLRQEFRYDVDDAGKIASLEFSQIGITLQFGDSEQ